MTAALLLQVLAAGLAAGAVYGLIGIGYGLVYALSGVLDFAHGDLLGFAIFAFLFALGGGGTVAIAHVGGAALAGAAAGALAVTIAVSLVIQRFAVRPFLEHDSTIGWVAALASIGLVLRALLGLRFSADSYAIPDMLPLSGVGRGGVVPMGGGAVLDLRAVLVLAIALLLAFALDRFLTGSKTGKAIRATAEEPTAAALIGIPGRRLQALTWAIAGASIVAGALLLAPTHPASIEFGLVLGLKGVAAATLGGLNRLRGAVLAGLALGLLESSFSNLYVPSAHLGALSIPQLGPVPALQDLLPLLVLVVALVLVPGRLGLHPAPAD
ncbi:MAG: ABC transporter permease subunit [Candidatus Dormibacteria bacterium]